MATRRQARTPDEKAASLRKQTDKARKRHKVVVTKRRKFTFEGEEEIVKDMIVILKLANYSNVQIAMITGISRKQVATFLEDGNVQKKYMTLKGKLPQAALELGRAYLIEAVAAVVHVMRTAIDDTTVLKAAAELFDRFGIPKSSRIETGTEEGDNPLSDPTVMDRIRKATPEKQAQIAELQEMWEQGIEQILKPEAEPADA